MNGPPVNARSRARTLTEALKSLSKRQLSDLLTVRPDLSYPLPGDVTELSSRAATATSIGRAMEVLNVWLRLVAEALAALPDPSSVADVAELLATDARATKTAVGELRRRALLWGENDQLHLVRGVREYFEPYPGGLAPPSPRPLTATQIDAALAECADSVHTLLERLLWSPAGAVRNAERRVDAAGARSPVEQLLARQLLRPLDADTVILPREVALRLRGGRFAAEPVSPVPPELTGPSRDGVLVDRAAAGAAFGLLHDVELAAHALADVPHRLLRTGGLGARDLTALGRLLSTDPAHAGFVLEVAAVTGLVAPGPSLTLLPTPDYDRWADRDAADRWRTLVDAWLRGARHYSRSTEPGAHVLGPEADAPTAPVLRRLVVELLAGAGSGITVEPDDLLAAVNWHYPRAARSDTALASVLGGIWREAGWLGLVSLGAVSSYASAVLAADLPLPRPLAELFPAPVDQIVVQADLTAVAPGPLPYALASELRLLADQESRGGGGVYRFSATSVRRGFEAGWSSTQVHRWLEQHSATPIPQPLAYLIDDMARQYGSIRVGTAVSYLRVEDPAHATALLAHPDARVLGLRTLAAGVLVATAEASDLVAFLRAAGHSPAVEDADGSTLSAPPQQRAASPRRPGVPVPMPAVEAAAAIVAGERSRPALTPVEANLRELELAAGEAVPVRVRYVAADGQPTERDVQPVQLGAGMLRAVDAADTQVAIPLARISSVCPVPGGR
ncbi:MAG TPA: helicase-associated domain-containing protein [Propionibacteriaceae bacterium]|nr:helicase-associated domain-containing protein [Propionibacteriaceae bacterium]